MPMCVYIYFFNTSCSFLADGPTASASDLGPFRLSNPKISLDVKKMNGSIYIIPQSKINHKGSAAINPKYKDEIDVVFLVTKIKKKIP